MTGIQIAAVLIYGLISLGSAMEGYRQSARKNNVFGETPLLTWMGIFVWGDAVIIGVFGALAAAALLYMRDWWLAVTVWAIFWMVRSLGETIYWLNQQFSGVKRNNPEKMRGYRFFPGDSVWFVYQIFWQCVTVGAVILSIYAANRWLS